MSISLAAESQQASSRIQAVKQIIAAVNLKDADQYASVFAEDAKVHLYRGPVRVDGREALRQNRSRHFEKFPEAFSEIQYIVEIDGVVVMHDRVWLNGRDADAADIVEIFEFEGDLIVRVDVIQRRGLLSSRPEE